MRGGFGEDLGEALQVVDEDGDGGVEEGDCHNGGEGGFVCGRWWLIWCVYGVRGM